MLTFMRTNAVGLHDEFVSEDANQVHGNSKVSRNEVLVVKVSVLGAASEDAEVLGQGNQNAEEQRKVRAPETERCNEGHLLVSNTLGAAGFDEEDVGDQKRNPSAETENGDQVDEVAEDLGGILCSIHESAAAEDR